MQNPDQGRPSGAQFVVPTHPKTRVVPSNHPAFLTEPSVQQIRANAPRPLNAAQQAIINQSIQPFPGQEVREFMNALDDFTPVIPDAVTLYYMNKAGIAEVEPRIVRLISLATQKYISDIVLDAMQETRMKGLGHSVSKKTPKDVKYTLTNEVLDAVLKEYGINITRAPYFH
ncbi:unnamed protein product, partial [Mesorhabditis belari]|uniref:Transcription initiation factor TFIID subunit 10 n=1 Tax=Mesorhabditis belari TaxID=2138241 RepID=A0AAF3EW87_9BILA